MKVAFHLRRRAVAEPASALLLETDRVDRLLELAGRLGQDQTPTIHTVSGGFLIKVDSNLDDVKGAAGSIRLRKLAENLFLPVDADLVPSLLDDEATGLTRDLGLIFLPGGRVLSFNAKTSVPSSSMVMASRSSGDGWRRFPDRPERPDRIREIVMELPPPDLDDLFGPGSVEEDPAADLDDATRPKPQNAGSAATFAAQAAVGLGKGLIGLGALLGIKSLANLGARWVGRAIEHVPRLTEAVLGKQEGALRELLRQFRDGEIERALRHAMPLGGGEGGRGGVPSTDHRLPTVDPTYSLQSLLGATGKGGRGVWLGGADVQNELAQEYRKAAERAERMGDFRRAAYIHARLLNDYTTAAHLLAKGGLYRDAAMLYLNRLQNIPAAARAFESAGEVDRALELYRQKGMHVEAGDLLRRLGEEDQAIEEYLLAADQIVNSGHGDHRRLTAGDLLRDRARRPDLAIGHYAIGWDCGVSKNSVACALRMAAIHAELGEARSLFTLFDQADALFEHRSGMGIMAADFYNQMAVMADGPALIEARDDLRDRSLMGLAAQIRQSVGQSRPNQVVSTYFGQSRAWTADVVDDAGHALQFAFALQVQRNARESSRITNPTRREGRRFAIAGGTVTAVCHASNTGEVFLGFDSGELYRVEIGRGEITRLDPEGLPVESLAVDPEGKFLVALVGEDSGPKQLVTRSRTLGSFQWGHQSRQLEGPGEFWMTPVMSIGSHHSVGIWDGEALTLMGTTGGDLNLGARLSLDFLKTQPQAALLIPRGAGYPGLTTLLIHDGSDICHADMDGRQINRRNLNWLPSLPEGNTLRSVPLAWLQVDPERIELAGLDGEGVIHWSSLKVNDHELVRSSNVVLAGDPPYLATTLVRAGVVVGVKAGQADWLRCGVNGYLTIGSVPQEFRAPLACFCSHRTDELIVVQADGTLVCVPAPL